VARHEQRSSRRIAAIPGMPQRREARRGSRRRHRDSTLGRRGASLSRIRGGVCQPSRPGVPVFLGWRRPERKGATMAAVTFSRRVLTGVVLIVGGALLALAALL